jgi:hypothetical protein
MALNKLRNDIMEGAFPDRKLELKYVAQLIRIYRSSGDKPFVYGVGDSVEITLLKEAGILREIDDIGIHKELGLDSYRSHMPEAVVLQFTEKGLQRARELSEEYELLKTQEHIRKKSS